MTPKNIQDLGLLIELKYDANLNGHDDLADALYHAINAKALVAGWLPSEGHKNACDELAWNGEISIPETRHHTISEEGTIR